MYLNIKSSKIQLALFKKIIFSDDFTVIYRKNTKKL